MIVSAVGRKKVKKKAAMMPITKQGLSDYCGTGI